MTEISTECINISLTKEVKNAVEQAANILGLSVSSFVLQSSIDRANELLDSNYELEAQKTDCEIFMSLLKEQRPANAEMKGLMRLLDEVLVQNYCTRKR